jgi:hypothetical protein
VHLPGVGQWRIDGISAELAPQPIAGPGEVVDLAFSDVADPGELPGALLLHEPLATTTSVALDVEDGGGRLWWPDGWVRILVKEGVATLRGPRVVAAGQRAVLARAGKWSMVTLG